MEINTTKQISDLLGIKHTCITNQCICKDEWVSKSSLLDWCYKNNTIPLNSNPNIHICSTDGGWINVLKLQKELSHSSNQNIRTDIPRCFHKREELDNEGGCPKPFDCFIKSHSSEDGEHKKPTTHSSPDTTCGDILGLNNTDSSPQDSFCKELSHSSDEYRVKPIQEHHDMMCLKKVE